MRQLVLALVLVGHAPYRAVVELFRDLFDYGIALGTVHNIVHSAVEPARAISRRVDLAGVRIGAHDEIFQAGKPVLVGVDTASTYCYLLSLEEHRDADTWGVRLLDLVDQGFNPDAAVADAGTSLRAGQALALPNVPCHGDVFHIIRDLKTVVSFLENRAYGALETSEQCERRRDRMRRPTRRSRAKSAHGPAQRCAEPVPPVMKLWHWSTMLLCWSTGFATTFSLSPAHVTPTVANCMTLSWPN